MASQTCAVRQPRRNIRADQRGSLALEQVLFIGAIVTMSVGLYSFYDDLRSYFDSFSVAGAPT
ncbi:MAG: hypothetical protein KDD44_13935, partial [Bdellovibrionales bacterium]|nr:hypothetical protein [Bdellovibrionales bacterium]